jgi:hypothetical protein
MLEIREPVLNAEITKSSGLGAIMGSVLLDLDIQNSKLVLESLTSYLITHWNTNYSLSAS